LSFLGEQLKIPLSDVETILVQLILDGEISGRIDQVNGILDLTQRTEGGGKKYSAIDAWTNALSMLTTHMAQPVTGGGGERGFRGMGMGMGMGGMGGMMPMGMF